ncbi:hypothetical protein Sjap_000955 [Stephania japonica]|uniref:GATA transcription factor n=1 Tax=Stephania japonica TaxID=461633 RepID=A0AAP0PSW3_9MAGN
MIEPNFMDDMDLDFCGDFFEHIDDLLDFPSEEVEGGALGDSNGLQSACPAPDTLPDSGNVFSGNSTDSGSELPTDLCIPHEDIAHLEWLSTFVEDSFSAGSIALEKGDYVCKNDKNNNKDLHQFRTSSPVSVLESSSSCSGGKAMPLIPETAIPGRARSKRPRPTTFNPRPRLPIISPTSSATISDHAAGVSSDLTSEFESFAESQPSKFLKPVGTEEKKKKKKKVAPAFGGADQSYLPHEQIAVRKCQHCEITKTPQWRAGPMGPKTLCNACGVRYKSGRLFPEYRPAASPTFVASLHSNSHKKVLEMRTKGGGGMKTAAAHRVASPPPELIPKSSHFLNYI